MFQAFLKAYGSEQFLSGNLTAILLRRFRDGLKSIDYSDEEVNHILNNTRHYINSNKSSMFEGFMS